MSKSTLEEANVIRKQIGNKAICMLGACNLSYDSEKYANFSFRIKGSSKVNHIEIVLNGNDLYDMKFNKIHGMKFKNVSTINDVYCDQLNEIIEKETGLYTSL